MPVESWGQKMEDWVDVVPDEKSRPPHSVLKFKQIDHRHAILITRLPPPGDAIPNVVSVVR